MASAVAVRPCRPNEIDSVLRLWARDQCKRPAFPSTQATTLEAPCALLVAEREDRVLGTLIATWDGWRGNMYRLAVEPAHRRQGIALALVRSGEMRLRASGARRITALVAGGDPVACALWASAGYHSEPGTARFVRNL